MNDGMGNITDWKVGQVNGTENIVIDYFGKYCDEALKEIAEKVGAEWWVEGRPSISASVSMESRWNSAITKGCCPLIPELQIMSSSTPGFILWAAAGTSTGEIRFYSASVARRSEVCRNQC